MMRRALLMTMVICWLLSRAVSAGAQDFFIPPSSITTLLLEKNDIQIEKNLDNIALGSLELKVVYVKSLRLASYDELLDNYVDIIRLERAKTRIMQSSVNTGDRKYIKTFLNPLRVDQEKLVRRQWKKFFGMDVWYPYYKAKEIEDWVKERCTIKMGKFKGKPQFRRDGIDYTFKMKF